MDYSPGSTFGYDQVYADVHLDGYDAPYTNVYGGDPHRTMQTPKNVSFREPIASYYETMRHPWRSQDSSLLEQTPPVEKDTIVQSTCSCSKPLSSCASSRGGIPGSIGKMLDCGCGCRGAKKISGLRSAKDKLINGDIDMNSMCVMFILVLALIIVMNAMNVKHLTKQVKMLTKAATRNMFVGPSSPANVG